MAFNFSPRNRRNKTVLSPQQSIIRSYFTPRNGITKEDVNFFVKPAKEPKFKRPASGMPRDSDGHSDQMTFTFPLAATGFTTAAKVHEQASKCKEELLSGQRDLEGRSCKSSVSSPRDLHSQTCADKNSFGDDLGYFSSGGKQAHVDVRTRVAPLPLIMSSSSSAFSSNSSSTSTSSRKVKRTQNRPNRRTIKTQKRHKQTVLISLLDSENGEESSDSDCFIVKHVARRNKNPLHVSDTDVEEISSCSQTSSAGSGQSSQTSVKKETTSSSASQASNSNESSQSSSACTKSARSSKSSRRTKKQSSACSSMYGLVGDDVSESEDDPEDLSHCGTEFSQLPVEIMENIFCQLPIIDLMLNCVLVCQQWNSIISRDSVLYLKEIKQSKN